MNSNTIWFFSLHENCFEGQPLAVGESYPNRGIDLAQHRFTPGLTVIDALKKALGMLFNQNGQWRHCYNHDLYAVKAELSTAPLLDGCDRNSQAASFTVLEMVEVNHLLCDFLCRMAERIIERQNKSGSYGVKKTSVDSVKARRLWLEGGLSDQEMQARQRKKKLDFYEWDGIMPGTPTYSYRRADFEAFAIVDDVCRLAATSESAPYNAFSAPSTTTVTRQAAECARDYARANAVALAWKARMERIGSTPASYLNFGLDNDLSEAEMTNFFAIQKDRGHDIDKTARAMGAAAFDRELEWQNATLLAMLEEKAARVAD